MYLTLQSSDEQTLENLPRLITVSYVLERLRSILATNIEEDLFSAAVASLLALFSLPVCALFSHW